MTLLFLKGFITGLLSPFLSISIALLIANLQMKGRPSIVRAGVLGIITINTLFALIASFGLHLAMVHLKADYRSFSMLGAMILFLLALRFYKTIPLIQVLDFTPPSSCKKSYFFAFLFAASFPITIIEYAAIYASLGVHSALPPFSLNGMLVLGTFLGMLIWWVLYLGVLKRNKIFSAHKLIDIFGKTSSLILICFSVIGLIQIYFK
ncbi:MAG: hypothetical protein KBC64_07600 [Simkaniaceae bacterium]|nr:hypothetical protein [Simkaniaceae bacterium]